MRVTFKTFGCRLNQAETTRFESDFAAAGWHVVPHSSPADVVVIHGCAVTRRSEQECLQLARSIKRRAEKDHIPAPFVVLTGCVVEARGDQSPSPAVDLQVSRQDKERLAEIVSSRFGFAAANARQQDTLPVRVSLKAQDGCDFNCTYCIVPYTRGAPVSRPFQAILDEAQALVQRGVSEIVLTGCNLACYRDQGQELPELAAALAALDSVVRVRLGSVEPATVERKLAGVMATHPKLCRHLHLPLQSGDAQVLRAMGRRYTPDAFIQSVRDLLRQVPGLGLGTDIITGFPGETDEAFENTKRLIEELPFSNLHVFPYSERQGTPAAASKPVVPPSVRKSRAMELIALHARKREAFAASWIGQPVQTVIEYRDPQGYGLGYSSEYLNCRVKDVGATDVGRLLTFYPSSAKNSILTGSRGGENKPHTPA